MQSAHPKTLKSGLLRTRWARFTDPDFGASAPHQEVALNRGLGTTYVNILFFFGGISVQMVEPVGHLAVPAGRNALSQQAADPVDTVACGINQSEVRDRTAP